MDMKLCENESNFDFFVCKVQCTLFCERLENLHLILNFLSLLATPDTIS